MEFNNDPDRMNEENCVIQEASEMEKTETTGVYVDLNSEAVTGFIDRILPGFDLEAPAYPKDRTFKTCVEDNEIKVRFRVSRQLGKIASALEIEKEISNDNDEEDDGGISLSDLLMSGGVTPTWNSGRCYDLYVAEQNYLSKEQVIKLLDQEDPNRRPDAYAFATPEIAKGTPKLKKEERIRRFLFFTAVAARLQDDRILTAIVKEHPRKAKGGFNLAKYQRITCMPLVTEDCKVPQLFAKASDEHTLVIEADLRRFSPEEMEQIRHDFLTCHEDLFGIVSGPVKD